MNFCPRIKKLVKLVLFFQFNEFLDSRAITFALFFWKILYTKFILKLTDLQPRMGTLTNKTLTDKVTLPHRLLQAMKKVHNLSQKKKDIALQTAYFMLSKVGLFSNFFHFVFNFPQKSANSLSLEHHLFRWIEQIFWQVEAKVKKNP